MDPEKITVPQNEALSRICEEVFELPQQPDEFTASQVAEKTGAERRTALNRLDKKEKDGILTSRMGHDNNGTYARLFKYVEDKEP